MPTPFLNFKNYKSIILDKRKESSHYGFDEEIDGIIKEDELGLYMIYLQAKRWKSDSTICVPKIKKFVGSLVGKKATKGIFITTTKFSKEARNYVEPIEKRVILIDGHELTDLMFKYNIGVLNEEVYITKKLDLDFSEQGLSKTNKYWISFSL